MLEPLLYRWMHTVLDVSCQLRLSSWMPLCCQAKNTKAQKEIVIVFSDYQCYRLASVCTRTWIVCNSRLCCRGIIEDTCDWVWIVCISRSCCIWIIEDVCDWVWICCYRCWCRQKIAFIALVSRTQSLCSTSLHVTQLTTTSGTVSSYTHLSMHTVTHTYIHTHLSAHER